MTFHWVTMESKSLVQAAAWKIALYSFGLLNWFLYLGLAISSGSFFKKDTEQDRLQLDIGELSCQRRNEYQLRGIQQRTNFGKCLRRSEKWLSILTLTFKEPLEVSHTSVLPPFLQAPQRPQTTLYHQCSSNQGRCQEPCHTHTRLS
jgi:hypothetical protein